MNAICVALAPLLIIAAAFSAKAQTNAKNANYSIDTLTSGITGLQIREMHNVWTDEGGVHVRQVCTNINNLEQPNLVKCDFNKEYVQMALIHFVPGQPAYMVDKGSYSGRLYHLQQGVRMEFPVQQGPNKVGTYAVTYNGKDQKGNRMYKEEIRLPSIRYPQPRGLNPSGGTKLVVMDKENLIVEARGDSNGMVDFRMMRIKK